MTSQSSPDDIKRELVMDRSGHSLVVTNFRGDRLPCFPPESLRRLDNFRFRDDDILISAYPKSGTHWLWEMVRMLQQGRIELPLVEKDDYMIEFDVTDIASLPSPRILTTHLLVRQLPGLHARTNCKILFVTRNPRDVTVSFYNHHKKLKDYYHYDGAWPDYLQLFLDGQLDYGSWFDHTVAWNTVIASRPELQTLRLSFEDMKENTPFELKRISQFLGYQRDDAFIQSVADACEFHNMKAKKGHFDVCSEGQSVMYRKGEVGDWQNWFTAEQLVNMEQVYAAKMADSSLTFRYTI